MSQLSSTHSLANSVGSYQGPSTEQRHGHARPRRNGTEPLKRFADAKKAIGDIFGHLEDNVNELYSYYCDVSQTGNVVPDEQLQEVKKFEESLATIKEMFQRDNMKVVFFGRTSNGKSTVINAMLHSKVLPQGMGHTTCCFLQVEGSADDEKYVMTEDGRKFEIAELGKLGHAMSDDNATLSTLGQDSLLTVFYPKSSSRLLQNDVVFVDSPGVDLSPEFDSWIDKHCLDADLFVLVCNAESTLTQAEKSFFYRVSRRLSKPNIFILNNRWDASAAEMEHVQQVREQHEMRFKQFLVDELKVCNEMEAKNRVFFISAREMLDARLKANGVIQKAYQMDGHQFRAVEFNNFETQFEQVISKSAINTKFEAHVRRGREIVEALRANLDSVKMAALEKRRDQEEQYTVSEKAFKQCLINWNEFDKAFVAEARKLQFEVHLKVSADFTEEINNLGKIIENFECKFSDEPQAIKIYKQMLAKYIDKTVAEDLQKSCINGLMERIRNLEKDVYERIRKILDEPYVQKFEEVWRYRVPFNFSMPVNCSLLMEDFAEDLEFRFSLGLTSLVRRIAAYRSGQPVTALNSQRFINHMQTSEQAMRSKNDGVRETQRERGKATLGVTTTDYTENAFIANIILTSSSYLAHGGLGLFILGGIAYKTIDWRLIAFGGLIYGGLYGLERWRWNSGAKEQHLKDQFRTHLAARMRGFASSHTANCESQVIREMEQVYKGLKSTVGGVHQDMKAELDIKRANVGKIDAVVKGLSTIRGKTSFMNTDFDKFENDFLKNGLTPSQL